MTRNPPLTICIPTFNRLHYLKETLPILLAQAELAGVEICISDNHSSDGTSQFLEELTKRGCAALKYITQADNIGLDGNMLAVIGMASGEYIYPLGDDDMLPMGTVNEILRELKNGGEVLILNGWHTDQLLVPLRKHLSDTIAGHIIREPDQAFTVLWDKMPFGSFIASRECFLPKYCLRYIGTSHAYAGAVWDAIADTAEIKGRCTVRCMQLPTVLLRGGEKTWKKNAAQIMLREIPQWFELVAKKTIYMKVAGIIQRDYMKRQTSFFSLAHFRSSGQLESGNVSALSTACSRPQKLKMAFIARLPISLLTHMTSIQSSIISMLRKKII